MKRLMYGFTVSASIVASHANAEITLTVDGKDYALSTLMANCQTETDDPVAQISCFREVSKLVEEQSKADVDPVISVPDSLEALRNLAEYQDDETGLILTGSDCNVQILYYNNYFHISRRNVSSIDLFSATFDASRLQMDQIAEVQGAQAPLYKGKLGDGAQAASLGGMALDSSQHNFTPKSARASIGDYAVQVSGELAHANGQEFEFVLVHPMKANLNAEIWGAFKTFAKACQQDL